MIYRFHSSKKDFAAKRLMDFCKEDTVYSMMVVKAKEKRSIQANKYYWGIVVKTISEHTGYTPQETHQVLGEQFWSYEKDGKRFIKSTSDMDSKEFADCIEKAIMFASVNLGLAIPSPDEVTNEMWMMLNDV